MVEGGGFVRGKRRQPTSLIDIAPTVLRHLQMDHDDMDGTALPRDADECSALRSGLTRTISKIIIDMRYRG